MGTNTITVASQANLFIIREIIRKCKGKVPVGIIYSFLFEYKNGNPPKKMNLDDLKKYEHRINTFLSCGEGDMKKFFETLISYGISEEFFTQGDYIDIPQNYIDNLKQRYEYSDDYSEKTLKSMIEKIWDGVLLIKNKNDTLIIDCVRRIIADSQNINLYNAPDLYESTDEITWLPFPATSSKSIKKFYMDQISSLHSQNKNVNFDVNAYQKGIAKIKKAGTSETIRKNLLLLIEIYAYLIELDGDQQNKIQKLYGFLGLSNDMVDSIYRNEESVELPCRQIANKLAPYKIPISYFRTDTPSKADCTKKIENAISDYYMYQDIDYLHDALYVDIGYRMDLECAIPVLGMYSLYSILNPNP